MGNGDATEKNNVCTKWHQVGHGVYTSNVTDNTAAQGGEQIVNYPEHKEKEMPKDKKGMKNDFSNHTSAIFLLH